MSCAKLFLVLLIVPIVVSCGGDNNSQIQSGENVGVDTYINEVQKVEIFKANNTFEYQGYVRTILKSNAYIGTRLTSATLIGFELNDGSVISIKLLYDDPRLWEGMHARIVIRKIYTLSIGEVFAERDFDTGEYVYELLTVKRID